MVSDLPRVTLPTWTELTSTDLLSFKAPLCWGPMEVIQFPRPHRKPLNNILDMWLFALYLIVPMTHSFHKVTVCHF